MQNCGKGVEENGSSPPGGGTAGRRMVKAQPAGGPRVTSAVGSCFHGHQGTGKIEGEALYGRWTIEKGKFTMHRSVLAEDANCVFFVAEVDADHSLMRFFVFRNNKSKVGREPCRMHDAPLAGPQPSHSTYDDPQPVAEKARYSWANGYAGVFFWQLGVDAAERQLLTTLSESLAALPSGDTDIDSPAPSSACGGGCYRKPASQARGNTLSPVAAAG